MNFALVGESMGDVEECIYESAVGCRRCVNSVVYVDYVV